MKTSMEPVPTRFIYDAIDRRRARRLPHWHARNGIQFLTWRLWDSLPVQTARKIQVRRKAVEDEGPSSAAVANQAWLDELEDELDRGFGSCYMNDPRVAEIVQRVIFHCDRSQYHVIAWSIMPNHVHVIAWRHCSLEYRASLEEAQFDPGEQAAGSKWPLLAEGVL